MNTIVPYETLWKNHERNRTCPIDCVKKTCATIVVQFIALHVHKTYAKKRLVENI